MLRRRRATTLRDPHRSLDACMAAGVIEATGAGAVAGAAAANTTGSTHTARIEALLSAG